MCILYFSCYYSILRSQGAIQGSNTLLQQQLELGVESSRGVLHVTWQETDWHERANELCNGGNLSLTTARQPLFQPNHELKPVVLFYSNNALDLTSYYSTS